MATISSHDARGLARLLLHWSAEAGFLATVSSLRQNTAIRRLASALVIVLAVRVAYLAVGKIHGADGFSRHHVESATVLFVLAALGCAYAFGRATERTARPGGPGAVYWALFVSIAAVLYWPTLSVGLLSDDYVLASRALDWNLAAVSSALFRPVPLFAWATLLNLGAGPPVLHLLNVVLHGTNAFLGAILVALVVGDSRAIRSDGAYGRRGNKGWSLLGGLLIVTAPIASEAVAWCSGIFDLSATTFVLTAVLLAARYEGGATPWTLRAGLFATMGAAVLSKETAAVAPILVLLMALLRRSLPKSLAIDTAIAAVVILAYGLIRMASSSDVPELPVNRYVLQRALFTTFGTLSLPFHGDMVRSLPIVISGYAIVIIGMVATFAVTPRYLREIHSAVAGAAWVILAVAPLALILAIPEDLQASRYLYLAQVGWAALLVAMASAIGSGRTAIPRVASAIVLTLVGVNATSVRLHVEPWLEAGRLRDRVLGAAAGTQAIPDCGEVSLDGLPDSVRGAYVFRNGASEAFSYHMGITITDTPSRPGCRFRWSEQDEAFFQVSGLNSEGRALQ